MDKEHVKGAADKAKGAMKDAAGKMLETRDCRLRGRWTGPSGIRRALGDAKAQLNSAHRALGREPIHLRVHRDGTEGGYRAALFRVERAE